MRWLWVSREMYDAAIRSHRESLQEHAETLEHIQIKSDAFQAAHERVVAVAEQRYNDLLARYHMLKLQGATVVESAPVREAPKADPVSAALAVACRGNEALLREQRRAVERDRAAGLSDEEIARRILAGNRVQTEFESSDTIPVTPSADRATDP